MLAIQVIAVAILPLAAALPWHVDTSTTLSKRRTWLQLSQFNFQPFNLSNICVECERATNATLFDCEIRFDWYDPNSVPENNLTSTTCVSKWQWDGVTSTKGANNTYATDYVLCAADYPTYFEMAFSTFDTAQNFTLDIAHHYKDDVNFTAPYDYPTTYSTPKVHLNPIKMNHTYLAFFDSGPLLAKITSVAD